LTDIVTKCIVIRFISYYLFIAEILSSALSAVYFDVCSYVHSVNELELTADDNVNENKT